LLLVVVFRLALLAGRVKVKRPPRHVLLLRSLGARRRSQLRPSRCWGSVVAAFLRIRCRTRRALLKRGWICLTTKMSSLSTSELRSRQQRAFEESSGADKSSPDNPPLILTFHLERARRDRLVPPRPPPRPRQPSRPSTCGQGCGQGCGRVAVSTTDLDVSSRAATPGRADNIIIIIIIKAGRAFHGSREVI
jgi:hypothetical protein